MNEILEKILKHPIAATVIITISLGSIADVIRAAKGNQRMPIIYYIKTEK